MSGEKSALSRPLVLARGRSGCCNYDPFATQELVLICLQLGVSIASEALLHGVNANLLRKWIHHCQAAVADHKADEPLLTFPAFVPVVPQSAKPKTSQCKPMALNEVLIVPGFGFSFESSMHAAVDPDFPGQACQRAFHQFYLTNPKFIVLVKHLVGTINANDAVIE
jgi:transposase-like protein